MPGPSSRMIICAPPSAVGFHSMLMVVPAGVCCTALKHKFVQTLLTSDSLPCSKRPMSMSVSKIWFLPDLLILKSSAMAERISPTATGVSFEFSSCWFSSFERVNKSVTMSLMRIAWSSAIEIFSLAACGNDSSALKSSRYPLTTVSGVFNSCDAFATNAERVSRSCTRWLTSRALKRYMFSA